MEEQILKKIEEIHEKQLFLDCATYVWAQYNSNQHIVDGDIACSDQECHRIFLEEELKTDFRKDDIEEALDNYFKDPTDSVNAIALARFIEN